MSPGMVGDGDDGLQGQLGMETNFAGMDGDGTNTHPVQLSNSKAPWL